MKQEGKINAYSFIPPPSKRVVGSEGEWGKDRQDAIAQFTVYLEEEEGEVGKASDEELAVTFNK